MVAEWVTTEFSSLSLGDSRLDDRVKSFVTDSSGICDSNPDRCRQKGSLKGLYRMVDNNKVRPDLLFAAHNQASRERCSEQALVYLLQDTTVVDLTKPKMVVQGAGPLGNGKRRGFFFHPSYAVSGDGIPLGQVDQVILVRDLESLDVSTKKERAADRRKACFAEKESSRWLEIQQSNEQLARSLPQTQFVTVGDSEADISDLFCESSDFPENFNLIVRGARQHTIASATDMATGNVIQPDPQGGVFKVEDALKLAQKRQFSKEVSVGARPEPVMPDDKQRQRKQARSARKAVLTIRTICVTLVGTKCPEGGRLPDTKINVVELIEEDPPAGDPPIHWVLYTTLPISSESQVMQAIVGYCMRWQIELYFKTLKSGLKIEDMKYRTLRRYLNAFAMLVPVAWRVEHLKQLARAEPDAPCSKYFPASQWIAIVMFQTKKTVQPDQPPTISEFLKMIALMGGYINKKSQGPPGSKTIWRGMARFETIVQAFQIFNHL